jgi:hypothetical protein
MNCPNPFSAATLPIANFMNRSSLRRGFDVVLLALAFTSALSPATRAVDPPPDGGYPNQNTAEGDNALFSTTSGFNNTAIVADALLHNATGNYNTATGVSALERNYNGSNNTATGSSALSQNTTGNANTANGFFVLVNNTTGHSNTASGSSALIDNTSGRFNTATGVQALLNNTTGHNNIAIGNNAGFNLTTGSNNIDIGNEGLAGESKKIRIGTQGTHNGTFIAGIAGVPATGSQVVINSNGQLGVATSSARFKKAVKPINKASEAILALEPVTFHYKEEIDPDNIPQFGLIAEQVEKVNPDLVARDDQGKAYTVRYEAVNAMLSMSS